MSNLDELTQEWIDLFEKDKANNGLRGSLYYMMAAGGAIPIGVNKNDSRVIEAIEHLRSIYPQKEQPEPPIR